VVLIGIDEITEEESNTMADEYRMALEGLLRKAEMEGDADFLREGVRVMSQALMELEVSQHLGAERHERTAERTGQRNGYRPRDWDTRVGTIELKVPRVRDGSFYPAMLDPRKRAERALVGVVQEAYVQGVSTRRVDDLVQALGMNGISKSQVSRLCQELDGEVERFRTRKLEGAYPYVWLDATYLKVRENSRVVSQAVVIAIGVKSTGEREILGIDHCEVGRALAEHWKLPAVLVQPMAFHHHPERADEENRPLVYAVHLGDLIAMLGGSGTGADSLGYELNPEYSNYIGLSQDRIGEIMLNVMMEFSKTMRLFS